MFDYFPGGELKPWEAAQGGSSAEPPAGEARPWLPVKWAQADTPRLPGHLGAPHVRGELFTSRTFLIVVPTGLMSQPC